MLMRRTFVTLLALGLISLAGFTRFSDAFEDTKWNIQVMPSDMSGNTKEFDDVLSFKGGQFSSREMSKQGFKSTRYEDDTRRGGVGSFVAEISSEKAGAAKWTGTVTAVQISGELVWTKKDGAVVNYTYRGERAPQK